MISTQQGAWWLTLLGTEPSRKRLAPVMPLLPTTMRSAPLLLGDVEDRVGRVALAREGRDLDAGASRAARPLAQRRVDVLARVDHPLQVGAAPAAPPRAAARRDRLVGADDLEPRAERAAASSTAWRTASLRGLRAVRAHHDRLEHRRRCCSGELDDRDDASRTRRTRRSATCVQIQNGDTGGPLLLRRSWRLIAPIVRLMSALIAVVAVTRSDCARSDALRRAGRELELGRVDRRAVVSRLADQLPVQRLQVGGRVDAAQVGHDRRRPRPRSPGALAPSAGVVVVVIFRAGS